jgi:MSHA biogenesis protein MshP
MRRVVSPNGTRQRGFALVAAVFVVVVLALLGIMMATIGGMQRATAAAATQGARAYHAARSGIEWGVFRALNDTATTCGLAPASTTTGFPLAGAGLDGFSVSVDCSYTIHKEGSDPEYNVFVITSTATSGNFGDAEYVSRRIRITATSADPS